MGLRKVLACLVLTGAVSAQIQFGEMGFQVTSPSGGTAGDSCWGFDCMPRGLRAGPGETLSTMLRAPLGGLYVVALSASASSCVRVPGIWNNVVVDPPLFVLFAGTVDQQNFTRFCYDGYAVPTIQLPRGLPSGTTFGLQAVATIGTPPQPSVGWGASSAILITLR